MTQIAMVNHIVCILFLITFTTALRTKQMSFVAEYYIDIMQAI